MRKMLLIACAGAAALLAGCKQAGSPVDVANMGDDNMRIWTDASTGCRYYIYRHPAGNATFGGITIRYNADGTPDCPVREVR